MTAPIPVVARSLVCALMLSQPLWTAHLLAVGALRHVLAGPLLLFMHAARKVVPAGVVDPPPLVHIVVLSTTHLKQN